MLERCNGGKGCTFSFLPPLRGRSSAKQRGGGAKYREGFLALSHRVQRSKNRVAHRFGADLRLARLHDVPGAQTIVQHGLDGAFQKRGVLNAREGIAQAHRKGEDRRQRIGEALAGDVRR